MVGSYVCSKIRSINIEKEFRGMCPTQCLVGHPLIEKACFVMTSVIIVIFHFEVESESLLEINPPKQYQPRWNSNRQHC
jgi:hypothetical protein